MATKGIKLPVHGHTAGIYADMSVDGPQIGTLVTIIDRAKNLPNRKTWGKQNAYCAARLGKGAKKTETDLRGGQKPRWDQELRFTVHESPDYYQLKVSVFNDGKKTDLIGETYVDLSMLIIPGGGQSDQWHVLQFKGKYAGEVRIEMTYYDTRPEDEAVIEKRKEAAEKIQSKSTNTVTSGSSLSGPRQPKVRRRPLPDDPTNLPSRSPALDYPQPAAHAHATLPQPATDNYPRPSSRHADVHSQQTHISSSGPQSPRGYDMPDDLLRERAILNNRQPAGNHVAYPPDARINPREQHAETYEAAFTESHPIQPKYDDIVQVAPNWQRHPGPQESYDCPPEADDIHRRNPYESPRQHSHQPTPDHGRYSAEPSYRHQPRSAPLAQPNGYEPTFSLPPMSSVPAPIEQGAHPQYNTSLVKHKGSRQGPLRRSMGPPEERLTYASMQPTVEDELEDGSAPPPPPMHRSSVSAGAQRPGLSPTSYKAYSQEYTLSLPGSQQQAGPPSMSPANLDLTHSGILVPARMTNAAQARSYPLNASPTPNTSVMPASLIAGYDTVGTTAEPSHTMHDSRSMQAPTKMPALPIPSSYSHDISPTQSPIQRLHTSPAPLEERSVPRKSRSTSPNPRAIPHRKSVSPRPAPVDERELSSIPFSPDSYDALNPRSSSSTREPRLRYETPDREMDAGKQSETRIQGDMEPIIGDDGRIIDPSDHLPSETWAPEPERKSKKPEVIIRFKHAPQSASHSAGSSPRDMGTPHHHPHQSMPATPDSGARTARHRLQKTNGRPQSYGQASNASPHTPPQPYSGSREYDHDGYSHQRPYSTQRTYGTPQSSRKSVSPSPSAHQTSPLYAVSNTGPPIPAKVPIAQPMTPNYPAVGMDALSQEMQSIDIGSAGWESGRSGRRYAPRTTVLTSYAR